MPTTPFTELCHHSLNALQFVHKFCDASVMPTALEVRNEKDRPDRARDAAIAGTFMQMFIWLGSLVKLNQTSDVLAIGAASRGIFELHLDLLWFDKFTGPEWAKRYWGFEAADRHARRLLILSLVATFPPGCEALGGLCGRQCEGSVDYGFWKGPDAIGREVIMFDREESGHDLEENEPYRLTAFFSYEMLDAFVKAVRLAVEVVSSSRVASLAGASSRSDAPSKSPAVVPSAGDLLTVSERIRRLLKHDRVRYNNLKEAFKTPKTRDKAGRAGRKILARNALARAVSCSRAAVSLTKEWKRLKTEFGFDVPDAATVLSGHGLHMYWRFVTPCTDLDAWRSLQKDLIACVRSDPSVHNPERIMRLPGFLNCKDHPYVLAEIAGVDDTRRYEFAHERRGSQNEQRFWGRMGGRCVEEDSAAAGVQRAVHRRRFQRQTRRAAAAPAADRPHVILLKVGGSAVTDCPQ
jgi:hypothetical protein